MGAKRIKKSELARMTGIRPNTISELWHGTADKVSLKQLDRICIALNCTLADILIFQRS